MTQPPRSPALPLAVSACLALLLAGCFGSGPATSIRIHVVDVPEGLAPFEFVGAVEPTGPQFTALVQLERFAAANGFELNTTYYPDFNATLVESIHHLSGQAGPDGQFYFWKFRLNGQDSDVGADRVVLEDGDEVEWAYVLE